MYWPAYLLGRWLLPSLFLQVAVGDAETHLGIVLLPLEDTEIEFGKHHRCTGTVYRYVFSTGILGK